MKRYERGDVVLIDYEKGKRMNPGFGNKITSGELGTGKGEILRRAGPDSYRIDPIDIKDKIEFSTYTDNLGVNEKAILGYYYICQRCDDEKIYHDNREEWLCPWCDL